MRWVWIDRFEEFTPGKSARAVKLVSRAEDHVHEPYPACPMLAPSLILEGLAQTGGILVGQANDFREKVVLAKIPFATIHGYAAPGDRLEYHAVLEQLEAGGAVVAAKAVRDGEVLVEAEIVFAHLDQSQAGAVFGSDNFVFHKDHLLALLKTAPGFAAGGADGAGAAKAGEASA